MPLTSIKAIDVTQAPYNVVGDGVTDCALKIQDAVNDAISQAYRSGI